MPISNAKQDDNEMGSIRFAQESHEKSDLGKPSKYMPLQKTLLVILAILAVGLLELLIIVLFTLFS